MGIKSWPGGVIRKTPVSPSGPYQSSTASGIWSLEQVAYWKKQSLWPTTGNIDPSFLIENLFSTYLYAGTSASQTITNGIDLSTKGGLVWTKNKTITTSHQLFDTSRGIYNWISSDSTGEQTTTTNTLTAFNSNGFTLGAGNPNSSGYNYVSWTFRKQPKFFDVVTYTGNGSSSRTISHSLGSAPGAIFVKKIEAVGVQKSWAVYHRSLTAGYYLSLNSTDSQISGTDFFPTTPPTSTEFYVGSNASVNENGTDYVAYLFAHNAGSFGASGTDNVISCGSYVGATTVDASVTLGWEPQWLLVKKVNASGTNWVIADNMRGMPVSTPTNVLFPNTSGAEYTPDSFLKPTATGFLAQQGNSDVNGVGSDTFIYIAIRRGPMKTPTSGTSVFSSIAYTGDNTNNRKINTTITPDLSITKARGDTLVPFWVSRLTNRVVDSSATTEERSPTTEYSFGGPLIDTDVQAGIKLAFGTSNGDNSNKSGITFINWNFKRASGFFDIVYYTGTGSNRTVSHNLSVAPELIIVKNRVALTSETGDWSVYAAPLTATNRTFLNLTAATNSSNQYWNDTEPTSSVFTVGINGRVNENTKTYVAYLFASCPGVSKVGSYTGTGTTLQVNCGFTSGARFVMIKRTDSTGDWYVWDTTRGIVAGNDPYLLINSSQGDVTNTDYIDTYNPGFEISSTAPAALNANGGTYIFLAIA